jgi:hypothetical protein
VNIQLLRRLLLRRLVKLQQRKLLLKWQLQHSNTMLHSLLR